MTHDVLIGYWASKYESNFPIPEADTAHPDQKEVIAKLKAFMESGYWTHYRGWSNCRICGKNNGSKELEVIIGNIKYRIPEGYLHYLEDHNVGYDPRLLEIIGSL